MKRFFTVIELLVVIVIIGILASVLMPSLSEAREKALAATCSTNFRQIGIAIQSYTDDADGFMPSVSGNSANSQHGWRDELVMYLSMNDKQTSEAPFKCPSSKLKHEWENHNVGSAYNRMFGDRRYQSRPARRLGEVILPAETIVVGDSIDWSNDWAVTSRLLKPSDTDDPIPVGNRHQGGINILWADFHMQWMPQPTLRQGKNGNIDYYYLIDK